MAPIQAPSRPVLTLNGITKVFGDFTALDEVTFALAPGQIHALLGANGSGKSTLVKVMSGVYHPDGGSMDFDGSRLAGMSSPAEAAQLGVRVVHQEAPLIDTMSVTEAVAMFRGFGTSLLGPIGWRQLRQRVQDLLDRMDVPISASQQCSTVGPADRAGLALAIVVGDLFENADPSSGTSVDRTGPDAVRLLIVDEVTAAIHESETGRHLDRLRAVADMGVAVVMVTHRLGELRVADDVTVLRGGRAVYRQAGTRRRTNAELVADMVGPDGGDSPGASAGRDTEPAGSAESSGADTGPLAGLWQAAPTRERPNATHGSANRSVLPGNAAIAVENLTGDVLSNCSFSASAGEIVGFAGLRGSGVEELPRLLSGDDTWRSGEVAVGEVDISRGGRPRDMIRAGLTAIPADRLRAGGVGSLSVRENVILPAMGNYWHRRALWNRVTDAVIKAFDVRPPRADRLFGSLSGGNQQKVLLGKWLLLRPSVLVLDDPTYGVDPGARETIFDAMVDAAARGVCVLFFSTEPEQLVRVCNRVLVLRGGEIITELCGKDLTLETVIEWSYQ